MTDYFVVNDGYWSSWNISVSMWSYPRLEVYDVQGQLAIL